ncbi:MAG: MFS transporter, partial [Polaromonas sp.]|nr:MFS transporter [Polaromonas sp.]
MTAASHDSADILGRRAGLLVFVAFAAAYFCSALLRAITATLAPVLTQEFSLHARDLGLLAGGYFLGFAATQLPMGAWLDRHGPKRVVLWFMSLAVIGCVAFSFANSFVWLLISRVLMGMGVSACLMAPLTGYRRWYSPAAVLRSNSLMLMTGSLGMLSSTLPVQWLMPYFGWRPLFWGLALLALGCMVAIAWLVPDWRANQNSSPEASLPAPSASYAEVWRNPYFRRLSPMAFFNSAGLVAIQTLWAGPWLVRVAGYSPLESAAGLFYINAFMLTAYLIWGIVNPWLMQRGWHATRLITWGVPLSLAVLAINIAAGPAAGWPLWALFCVSCTFMSLAQPAVGMAFPAALAGRALSAFNLLIFIGVFVLQWGIGLL